MTLSNSVSHLPNDLLGMIIGCIIPPQPQRVTNQQVKECARKTKEIALINKFTYEVCLERLMDLKKIYQLVNMYSAYNSDYERDEDYESNPHLLDAVFTAWPYLLGIHSQVNFSEETEEDIKEIIRLTPQSINCNDMGHTRLYRASPLLAACENPQVPLRIVKLLLEKGADPFFMINYEWSVFDLIIDEKSEGMKQLFKGFAFKRQTLMVFAHQKDPNSLLAAIPSELIKTILNKTYQNY